MISSAEVALIDAMVFEVSSEVVIKNLISESTINEFPSKVRLKVPFVEGESR